MPSLEYPRAVFGRHPGIVGLTDSKARDRYLDILDVVFFASMLPEEGEAVRIGVVVDDDGDLEQITDGHAPQSPFEQPSRAWFVVRFEAIELTPAALKRLARGTDYGRDLIVVGHEGDRLAITGLARRRDYTDGGQVLRIAAPRPGELILEGVNRQLHRYVVGSEQPIEPNLLEDDGPARDALRACQLDKHRWLLAEVLRYARASQRGAMFLCLPEAARADMVKDIRYRYSEPETIERLERLRQKQLFQGIAASHVDAPVDPDDLEEDRQHEAEADQTRAELGAAVEMLGQLSAIDGAVVIEPGFRVLGGGFIIPTGKEQLPTPIHCNDAAAVKTEPRPISGGARRAAGLRFAWLTSGSVVFIVSSDGPVTCAVRRGDELLTWLVRLPET